MAEVINFVIVLMVAVCVAGGISVLYSSGLRLWYASKKDSTGVRMGARIGSVCCFATCVVIVFFALWLMIPIFH